MIVPPWFPPHLKVLRLRRPCTNAAGVPTGYGLEEKGFEPLRRLSPWPAVSPTAPDPPERPVSALLAQPSRDFPELAVPTPPPLRAEELKWRIAVPSGVMMGNLRPRVKHLG